MDLVLQIVNNLKTVHRVMYHHEFPPKFAFQAQLNLIKNLSYCMLSQARSMCAIFLKC